MTRLTLLGLAFVAGFAFAAPAIAQDEGDKPAATQQQDAPVPGPAPTGPVATVKVGFLGLQNDIRYHPEVAYTRIQLSPAINPVEGARMGIDDLRIVDQAVNLSLSLDEQMAKDGNDALAKIQAMVAAGERFVILDLPGDLVAQLIPATVNLKVTLVNATAPEDGLRNFCSANIVHTGASDRMVADTYMQFLRHRNWNRVLILYGHEPRDKLMADAFAASAQRLGVTIVDTRQFTMATDPANRELNNTALITGNAADLENAQGATGIFVRRPGENQSYLARTVFPLRSNVADWLETGVMGIEAARQYATQFHRARACGTAADRRQDRSDARHASPLALKNALSLAAERTKLIELNQSRATSDHAAAADGAPARFSSTITPVAVLEIGMW